MTLSQGPGEAGKSGASVGSEPDGGLSPLSQAKLGCPGQATGACQMPFYFTSGHIFDLLPSLIQKVGCWLPGAWGKEGEMAAQWIQLKLQEIGSTKDNTLLSMDSSKIIAVNPVSLMSPCLAWCGLEFP